MGDLRRKIKESKKVIENSRVNNPNELYSRSQDTKKEKSFIFNSNLILKYVLIFLMIVTISVSSVAIYKTSNSSGGNTGLFGDDEPEHFSGVLNTTSLTQLKNIVNGYYAPTDSNDLLEGGLGQGEKGDAAGDSFVDEDMGIIGSGPTYSGSGSIVSGDINVDRIYGTNIQDKAVDEADIVKVNGDYIYYIPTIPRYYSNSNGYFELVDEVPSCMYILKAQGDDIEVVSEISMDTEKKRVAGNSEVEVYEYKISKPKDLYFTDEYLIVRVSVDRKSQIVKKNNSSYVSNTDYRYYTEFLIYDIDNYELVKDITIPGNYTSSRLIDDKLYVISNYNEYKSYNEYIPKYIVNDVEVEANFSDIFYCPSFGLSINSYVSIFKITLGKRNIEIDNLYFLSPYISKLYVNENSIYLIKNYSTTQNVEKTYKEKWTSSKVLVINIEDEMKFDGLITVKGNINDKYWIDEYDGFLRVASTGTKTTYDLVGGIYQYNARSSIFNYITIFKKNSDGLWEEVSSIKEGLGEVGESMKSARFNGYVATVVTFRQTDPLYYIDLTDHYNPKITSALKISGFSVYQHPYKDNYVIGIGYETSSTGSTTGYKVALFDVSDKENIKQVGQPLVYSKNAYISPSVLSNPKALFLDLENDIFGFSITGSRLRINSSNKLYTVTYYYNVYKINLENEIVPIKTIFTKEVTKAVYSTTNILDRMVFIKDKYYLLSYDKVYIYQLSSEGLTEIGEKVL